MEWLFLLFPIIAAGVAKQIHPRRLAAWEVAVPFFACIIAIFIGKASADYFATSDTEYLGGYLVQSSYYEDWDEEVPCRHPRYCTRSVSDGKGGTRTESYVCGNEHAYDVDYHPEYWEIVDSNGTSWIVNRGDFESLCVEWKNKQFVDLHRDYHSNDGDKYETNWTYDYNTLHPTVIEHTYENRVAASDSVLNYREVPESEKKQFDLFEYPRTSFFCPSVLGNYSHPGNIDLDKTNALFGKEHQIRIWLLCFKNQPLQAAMSQEAYWKRGNKNELVICTSLDDENKIQWSHVFSWSDAEGMKITIRQWLEDRTGQVLDIKALNEFIKPEIKKNWQRKSFEEFKFLAVKPPLWAYFMIAVVVIATTAGCLAWGINNDHYA